MRKHNTTMAKRKFHIVGWYRRLYMMEHTPTVAAALALAVMPVVLYSGLCSGALGLPTLYELFIGFLLVITLFYSIRKHKLLLMQAATVGLLFVMLLAQAQYALGELWSVDSETYITMGLNGFIFLAGEQMILFVQSLVCLNYFFIFVARRRGATRMSVNRAAILFLLALLVVQLAIAPGLSLESTYILHVWTLLLDELAIFVLVAHAELILFIDAQELAGE